ncbi:nucleotide sugar dehydrogenase [Streptomyces radicis]|uniref:Nucleotide sugar dehydrogenase n=1 Tax=Streptomyces radicis TaxID=1750517 RepID=A0A3A9WF81_9ACTN|nr:nucleotide sugar dehydrogenase [Streptomyces radicis]RKN08074.1 nucleotide sugar dehydrogenase [Streptomyces radicis]RKN20429.1 nucleotide sugar dehydrogenase [Streptomyces radicis]
MPADLAVLGLEQLGLPAAQAATAAGVATVGFTPEHATATWLNAGRAPAGGALSAAELRRMLATGFRATSDPAVLGRVRTALICAPTPPGAGRAPDLGALRAVTEALAAHLRPRTLVVVESAVHPGTTHDVVRPLLERGSGLRAGRDFHLACAPGRGDPGGRAPGSAPRVIGGLTPACTEAAAAFYGRLTDKVVRAKGVAEAEAVKVLETNFRHVNTALVNEMAVLCHDVGIDLWDVVRCAETRPHGPAPFRPGPGVGGHAAPMDPGGRLRLVGLAREVNERMPRYVTERAAALLNEHGKSARGARVLLLGVTHTPDVPDLPDEEATPAHEIATRLMALGAQLTYHDPLVARWRVAGHPIPRAVALYEAAADADLTLLLQPHATYDLQGLAAKAPLLLDTRGATPAGAAHRL